MGDGERLVPAPVFLLSSIRSGSTLLRVILDSHPDIVAPHEMHLRKVQVKLGSDNAVAGMRALGLTPRDLENLLWDRVLHLQLVRSGKSVVVDKTPQNVFDWERLLLGWPQARYIVLFRHPAQVFDSMRRAWPGDDAQAHYRLTTRYAKALRRASEQLPAIIVRYEELVADPADATHRLCDYLGVPWAAGMLNYAEQDHGEFRSRLGDWSATLRSGVVRPPQPPPDVVPEQLREACHLLGYS